MSYRYPQPPGLAQQATALEELANGAAQCRADSVTGLQSTVSCATARLLSPGKLMRFFRSGWKTRIRSSKQTTAGRTSREPGACSLTTGQPNDRYRYRLKANVRAGASVFLSSNCSGPSSLAEDLMRILRVPSPRMAPSLGRPQSRRCSPSSHLRSRRTTGRPFGPRCDRKPGSSLLDGSLRSGQSYAL